MSISAYLRRLCEEDFRTEKLQREGCALFSNACYGGTVDVLVAYHHVQMQRGAVPDLAFERKGHFYRFLVLPFGLATAPRIFPNVCGRSHRPFPALWGVLGHPLFGRSDLGGGRSRHHGQAGETMCQMLLCILPRFGWLVHPTKCLGCYEPAAEFVVLAPLGTSVDLAAQKFLVPANKLAQLGMGVPVRAN